MTQTEQIIIAMAAALRLAGLTVRDDTDALFSFEDMPVIVIDASDEAPAPASAVGFIQWSLSVSLLIGATGAVPKLAPEPTRAAAHSALYADRTLGGLAIDIVAGSVRRAIDQENPQAGITEAVYQVTYRQLEDLL